MKKKFLVIAFVSALPILMSAQVYLSDDQEKNIKLSGRYYWDEGFDTDGDRASQQALNNLTLRIISDVVYQTKKRDEVLKELEMNAHTGQIALEGMVCVLAWIARDSVFVTAQRPLNPPPVRVDATQSTNAPAKEQPITAKSEHSIEDKVIDPVLQELTGCKSYRDVQRVANRRGLVKGSINSSDGFVNPEQCFVAVFDSKGTLVALLDKGTAARLDLLSGQTIQNPESYYHAQNYYLWYLQKK